MDQLGNDQDGSPSAAQPDLSIPGVPWKAILLGFVALVVVGAIAGAIWLGRPVDHSRWFGETDHRTEAEDRIDERVSTTARRMSDSRFDLPPEQRDDRAIVVAAAVGTENAEVLVASGRVLSDGARIVARYTEPWLDGENQSVQCVEYDVRETWYEVQTTTVDCPAGPAISVPPRQYSNSYRLNPEPDAD